MNEMTVPDGGERGDMVAPRSSPFPAQTTAPVSANAQTSVESQRAMAEVQAAIFMAKQFPRDARAAFDRIQIACQRPGLAATAIYEYARGGTNIRGASIRLAECIANEWGNIQYGIKELERTPRAVTAMAYAWNVETNTRAERVATVPNERHTKYGVTHLSDPRDIYENMANQMARRLRACILQVVPSDVVEAAVEECGRTQKANVDMSTDTIRKLLAAFEGFGVTRRHIEKRIQRSIDSITPGNVIGLRNIYASLSDGMAKPADFFEIEPEKNPAIEEAKEQLKSGGKKTASKRQAAQKTDMEIALDNINSAANEAELDVLWGKIKSGLGEDDQRELFYEIQRRRKELQGK